MASINARGRVIAAVKVPLVTVPMLARAKAGRVWTRQLVLQSKADLLRLKNNFL